MRGDAVKGSHGTTALGLAAVLVGLWPAAVTAQSPAPPSAGGPDAPAVLAPPTPHPADDAPAVEALPADPAAPQAAPGAEGAATAAPVQVQARLSKDAPVFGDRIEVEVTLTHPADIRVFFPPRPNLKPLLTLPDDPGTSERTEANGVVTEKLRIPAMVVRTGLLRTPEIEVPYHRVTPGGGAGESGTVMVPALRATVRSQFAGDTDVKAAPLPPPLPLVEENVPLEVGLFVLAMMLLAGALTFLGLRVYRSRARRDEPKPQLPPHVVAFGRIEALARSGRISEAEARLVYGEISEILREYLAGRYAFPALDMTSTELLRSLQAVDLQGLDVQSFSDFTASSDLVKFARQAATPEELGEALAFVRSVVERTMQTPEEIERLKAQRLARLARQQRLRVQVMAPAPLRLHGFGLDMVIGAFATFLIAWLAIDTGQQGLFDAAYGLLLVWLVIRDTLGEGSPGKAIAGLRIAQFDPRVEVDPEAALRDDDAAFRERTQARMADLGARLKRNLLMAVPGAGVVAEAITCLYLPELRRLGDQWAETRVIDARYGLRSGQARWWSGALLLAVALVLLLLPVLLLGGRPQ